MSATATAVKTFAIDKTHSEAIFQVRHLVTRVRGRFTDLGGSITFDEASPERSTVAFTIQAASIDTGTPDRDAHLRSQDFFHVEQHPAITFVSTAIRALGGDAFEVSGDLTMRGVTKRITLPVTYLGKAKDPWGNEKIRLRGRDGHQPERLRADVERGARDRRVPGGRRGEGLRVDPGGVAVGPGGALDRVTAACPGWDGPLPCQPGGVFQAGGFHGAHDDQAGQGITGRDDGVGAAERHQQARQPARRAPDALDRHRRGHRRVASYEPGVRDGLGRRAELPQPGEAG